MSEKYITIKDLGTIRFRKSLKSKKVKIAIYPSRGVEVSLPYYLSYQYALQFVENKKDWITKHLSKIEKIKQNAAVYNETSEFRTRHRTLEIQTHPKALVSVRITTGAIQIRYPEAIPVTDQRVQNIIKGAITKALRIEAKEYLPLRIQFFAEKFQFRYNKVFIKNNKTLWGSCSAKNNINLNLHLMRLPDILADYVILHELCHTIEKNHGPKFWQLLTSVMPEAMKYSKELRQYTTQI